MDYATETIAAAAEAAGFEYDVNSDADMATLDLAVRYANFDWKAGVDDERDDWRTARDVGTELKKLRDGVWAGSNGQVLHPCHSMSLEAAVFQAGRGASRVENYEFGTTWFRMNADEVTELKEALDTDEPCEACRYEPDRLGMLE